MTPDPLTPSPDRATYDARRWLDAVIHSGLNTIGREKVVELLAGYDAARNPDAPLPDSPTLRIYTKCPACGNDTLTVNDDKHLLCTWISCPDPTLIDRVAALVKEREELKLTIETAEGRMMVHPADNRTLLDLVSAHLVAEDKLRGELFTAEAHIGVLREALSRISNLYFGEATAIAKDALASQPDLPLIEEVREAVNYAIEGLERFHSDVLIWKHESVNILTPAPNHVHIHQRLRQLLTRLNPAKL